MRSLDLADRHFYRDLLRIALPIALQNLVSSAVNLLDTIMVGRLGAPEIAAVSLGNQVYFLLLLLLFGLGSGAGVFTAQYWGKRDLAGVRRSFGLSLAVGAAASLAYTLAALAAPRFLLGLYSRDAEVLSLGTPYLRIASLSYLPMAASFILGLALRSVERPRLPLVATVVSLSLNAFLNWILIFGKLGAPALGVAGAAWATVIARWVEALLLFVLTYARKLPPAGRFRELFRWEGAWIGRFIGIALPVVANEVLWSLGVTAYNGIFARIGTGAIAAFSVVGSISQIAMVLFFGTGNAAAVMIGKKIGEGDREKAFAYARRFVILAPALGIFVGLLLLPVRPLLPILFAVPPEVLREAGIMLAVLGLSLPFKVFNLHVVVGICRAGGDTRFGMLFDLAGVWGLGVPLAALGAFLWGLPAWAVYLLSMSDEFGKVFLGLWRLASRKWLRDVTV